MFFFLSALVLYVAVNHNDRNPKLKRCFHRVTTNRQYRGGQQICTMRATWTTDAIKGNQGTQGEGDGDKSDFWVHVDIECFHTHLPKTKKKKAPDFRHPDEVLKLHTM